MIDDARQDGSPRGRGLGREMDDSQAAETGLSGEDDSGLLRPARRAPVPRSLHVIKRDSFEEAVERAVAEALQANGARVSPQRARALGRSVRESLARYIGQAGRRMRGLSRKEFLLQLDRARDRTLVERDRAREELVGVERELEAARTLARERYESLVRAGEAPPQLGGLREDLSALLTSWEAGELSREDLARAMVGLAESAARTEIDRGARRQASEYEQQIDRLERRVKKLSASLEATEHALQAVSRLKAIDPGLASIYRTVQGLSLEDGLARAKLAMLERLFEANRLLQAR